MKLYQAVYEGTYGDICVDAWYRTKSAANDAFRKNTADFDEVVQHMRHLKFVIREKQVSFWKWIFN